MASFTCQTVDEAMSVFMPADRNSGASGQQGRGNFGGSARGNFRAGTKGNFGGGARRNFGGRAKVTYPDYSGH